ncbi:predicted protein [Micromonas commoda]|uniref:Uncharacterized protein n=1 Tax=Micromonas commoda (strain RCC299 / NOUM17 / CCMP2709) TaxID=296587 RepID=C1FF09_MICCC|nr:predicted protein [Micromonas commoda]ACO68279.1 predicted protein [Micromonas commoda]|eukprot:XP_002507021.1 predicted protein [Micromonas commoda]
MSAATIASLRAAAEAQKASAERALRTLDEMEARGDTDDDASEELASLASTVAEELGGVVESWRGAADGNKPREMVGVGLMMGGMSLGELKGAIASRPSKNTDDDDDGANDANRKIGVRVVPASSSTPVAPNVAGGKPAWMLELEAKKRAKAASERHVG